MKSSEIREKFIDFYQKRGHEHLAASPLIPQNDPTVLFTTAGMQQFKSFYLDPAQSKCKKPVTVQPCIRTSDIDEVGNDIHLTMLEMLGNFSFGDYFKYEAIRWAWEFITEELEISPKRIYATVFQGDKNTPTDMESIRIWREIGLSDSKIKMGDRIDNFWGPTGAEGPCGPTTEIYVDGYEIWNIVFNQYYQYKDKKLEELLHPGIDTGMGLERLAAVMQGKKSIYEIDIFSPIIQHINRIATKNIEKSQRIVADHARAITFIIAEGIIPSNKEQGYVLRRLIRRMVVHAELLGISEVTNKIIPVVISTLKDSYYYLVDKEKQILEIAITEEEKFAKTLKLGLKRLGKILQEGKEKISGSEAFLLYDSFGFPLELIEELAHTKKIKVDKAGFALEMTKQKERSRTAAKGLFKGGLAGASEGEVKLHTATHLLHAALRKVFGERVGQMGSNINSERLRFDFLHKEKLTIEQIKEIEDLVNEQIKKELPVKMEEMTLNAARDSAALGFFHHKYGEKVKVYSIGPSTIRQAHGRTESGQSATSSGRPFSVEICGGPHIKNTRELGRFKITKEESSSAGVRRIKAVLI